MKFIAQEILINSQGPCRSSEQPSDLFPQSQSWLIFLIQQPNTTLYQLMIFASATGKKQENHKQIQCTQKDITKKTIYITVKQEVKFKG